MRALLLLGSVLVLVLIAAWLMDVQRRLKWKASEGGHYPAQVREALALIDLAAEGLFAGREVSDGALAECAAAFSEFHRYLNQRNNTKNNNRFSLVDRQASNGCSGPRRVPGGPSRGVKAPEQTQQLRFRV